MNELFYSQHGEDFILDKIFSNPTGFYIEVGCIDGSIFSNTIYFEKKGWKGICIEAHSGYIDLIKKNRPNSQVVHCAIGEKDEGEVTFYANARGSLSSLDKSTEERWKKDYQQYFSGFEEQKVSKRTLTSVFDELAVKKIDFISIDIEGYEVQALEGLNFNKYHPTIILLEFDSNEQKYSIEKILLPAGYSLILNYGSNLYYSLNPSHKKIVENKVFKDINLMQTKHPVDEGTDTQHLITIDTRTEKSQGFLEKSLRKIKQLVTGNR